MVNAVVLDGCSGIGVGLSTHVNVLPVGGLMVVVLGRMGAAAGVRTHCHSMKASACVPRLFPMMSAIRRVWANINARASSGWPSTMARESVVVLMDDRTQLAGAVGGHEVMTHALDHRLQCDLEDPVAGQRGGRCVEAGRRVSGGALRRCHVVIRRPDRRVPLLTDCSAPCCRR